jgi:hypothetical protein
MNIVYTNTNPQVRRQSTVVFLIVAALFIAMLAMLNQNHGSVATTKVTVFSGQSLWSLADQMHLNRDPRDWIADVVSLNHLETSTLMPGMTLTVPTK